MLGELTVNYTDRRVSIVGCPFQLTGIEYRLLFELSVNVSGMVSFAELLQRVWGPAHSLRSEPLRTAVKNLRRKLGDGADNPTYAVKSRLPWPFPTLSCSLVTIQTGQIRGRLKAWTGK